MVPLEQEDRLGVLIVQVTRIETTLGQLKNDLLGNGQPGRIADLEAEVKEHDRQISRQKGIAAAIAFLGAALVQFGIWLVGKRH